MLTYLAISCTVITLNGKSLGCLNTGEIKYQPADKCICVNEMKIVGSAKPYPGLKYFLSPQLRVVDLTGKTSGLCHLFRSTFE